jgi:RIP metalloprotease RseP
MGVPLEMTWVTPQDETRTAFIQPQVTETQFPSTLGYSSGRKIPFTEIGIQIRRDREKFGLIGALGQGVGQTTQWCFIFVDLFQKLISGEFSGRLMGGPIAIYQGSASQARWGAEEFFRWIAILSANLAIINLFPIPILDGGHIAIYIIEMVRRKRLSARTLEWAYRVAFFLVLLPLIVMIFYVDIDRLGWFDSLRKLFSP